MKLYLSLLIPIALFVVVDSRKHHLTVTDDERHYFLGSSFGFRRGGLLTITVSGFHVDAISSTTPAAASNFDIEKDGHYGFTIDKSRNFEVATYFEKNQDRCIFDDTDRVPVMDNATAMILLEIMMETDTHALPEVSISKIGNNIEGIRMFSCSQNLVTEGKVADLLMAEQDHPSPNASADIVEIVERYPELRNCSTDLSKGVKLIKRPGNGYYFSMALYMADYANEGAYSVFYHNCPNYNLQKVTKTKLTLDIVEKNDKDYLSIGERFTPTVYFVMAGMFFVAGFVWANVLRRGEKDVFKLHYVMLVLVFLKATSLMCHGINFHFISKYGAPIEGWAILFYVTHLLKGALLFITLVLIGTGWAFIKNFLTRKEKKVFLVIIPLQVLANIAWIIVEESEAGDQRFAIWSYVLMFVDLFCCGCILIPIVWSIRHLSEAAGTDGKAASNLTRMKLFRRFYTLVVGYIYFTRIVVMIFNMTVPFRYTYLNVVFQEGGTFIFFILTGYTFRPTLENPYLHLSQDIEDDSEDVELDDVVVFDHNRTDKVMMRNSNTRVVQEDEVHLINQNRA